MATKSGLGYSPISGRIYWGRQSEKTGTWSGEKRDVTSMFLQVMEHKFPVGFQQNITVNGEHKSTIAHVPAGSEVFCVENDFEFDESMYEKIMKTIGAKKPTEKQKAFVRFLCKS